MSFAVGDLLFLGRTVAEVLAVNADSYDMRAFNPGQGFVTISKAGLEGVAAKMTYASPQPSYMPAPETEVFWRSNGCTSKAEGGTAPLVGDSLHTVSQGCFTQDAGTAGNLYVLTEDGEGNSVWVADIEVVASLNGPPALP